MNHLVKIQRRMMPLGWEVHNLTWVQNALHPAAVLLCSGGSEPLRGGGVRIPNGWIIRWLEDFYFCCCSWNVCYVSWVFVASFIKGVCKRTPALTPTEALAESRAVRVPRNTCSDAANTKAQRDVSLEGCSRNLHRLWHGVFVRVDHFTQTSSVAGVVVVAEPEIRLVATQLFRATCVRSVVALFRRVVERLLDVLFERHFPLVVTVRVCCRERDNCLAVLLEHSVALDSP